MSSEDTRFPSHHAQHRPSPLQGARDAKHGGLHAATAQPGVADDDVPSPRAAPAPHRNLMMTLAAPILARIAGQRTGRIRLPLKDLHREMTAEITAFDEAISRAYPKDVAYSARYAVCATVDDVAMSLPDQGADAAQYAQRNMVYQFFGDNIGGDRFVVLMNQMLAKPEAYQDLLELFHACLAAGFGGRIRVAGGQEASQAQMRAIFDALDHPKDLSSTELSPRWQGVTAPPRATGVWGGVLLVAAIAAATLLVIYLLLKLSLGVSGETAKKAYGELYPSQKAAVVRAPGATAAPGGAQVTALSGCLATQKAAGQVVIEDGPSSVWVRTTAGEMFRPGSAELQPDMAPLFQQIARCIDAQPGPVQVVGYTDNDQIHTLQFPDNQRLSEARAASTARLIKGELRDGSRVSSEGRGDDPTVADNGTAAGKRLNRRVEIVLQRTS